MSLSTMLNLELPHINVLSKIDLVERIIIDTNTHDDDGHDDDDDFSKLPCKG